MSGRRNRSVAMVEHLRSTFPLPVAVDELKIELRAGSDVVLRTAARMVEAGLLEEAKVPRPADRKVGQAPFKRGWRATPPPLDRSRSSWLMARAEVLEALASTKEAS